MKQKKCKACGIIFTPERRFQVVCDYNCGLAYNKEMSVKAAKRKADKKHREDKARIKRRSQWMREAQAVVNACARERDRDRPCISCGRHHTGQYHAGHYRSVGAAPELRFELSNIHKQCSACNTHLSGNLIEYRMGLLQRYGREAVDWLEGPHEAKKYTIDDLKAIKAKYQGELKKMKKEQVSGY